MSTSRDEDEIRPDEPVVVRDRRKVDPDTGELRQESVEQEAPASGGVPSSADNAASDEPVVGELVSDSGEVPASAESAGSQVDQELAERTADLKRVQAEYANYRKRVERDREAERTAAQAGALEPLLPVLDDLGRAEAHGDLTGAFKAVADKLTDALTQSGLAAFGAEGDVFDPSVHEAVQHSTSAEVSGPTVTAVLRQGYALGDRVLRNAMVAVTDYEPEDHPVVAEADEAPSGADAPIDPPAEGELPLDGDTR